MPNIVYQVIQLTGPSETLQYIHDTYEANRDFLEALVPPTGNTRGRFIPEQDVYSRNTNRQIQTWGSKSATLIDYRAVREDETQTIKTILICVQSDWDPLVNYCMHLPDGITAILAYKGFPSYCGIHLIQDGEVIESLSLTVPKAQRVCQCQSADGQCSCEQVLKQKEKECRARLMDYVEDGMKDPLLIQLFVD